MKKRLNPNKPKIHRSYTVDEVTELYGVHKRTVRNWIKDGLPVIDDIRPMLILGTDLRIYIQNKRKGSKSKCSPSEIYCFRCQMPRHAKLGTAKYRLEVSGIGRVFARCDSCGLKVNKYFSVRLLDKICNDFSIEITDSIKTHNYES